MFFQELDLLEIRLSYLDAYVDRFLIVEACQTFSGKPKGFVFEEHAHRFSAYLHKIDYQKITDFHRDFQSVQQYLKNAGTPSHQKILKFMEQHSHYPKTEFNWVLESYHRECIHLALDSVADDEDIVIISDLDEIPCVQLFNAKNLSSISDRPRVCQQREFRYFLNYYKDSDWLGSIAGQYQVIGQKSLNLLRRDSKATREIVHPDSIKDCGYHYTSCGSVDMIREKIKSWSHQELNNSVVLNNLEKNILSGQDIFLRESGTNLKRVDITDRKFFDSDMSSLILQFPHLITDEQIDVIKPSLFRDLWRGGVMIWQKIQYKLSRLIKIKNNI